MEKEKTFLETNPAKDSFEAVLADQTLTGLTHQERIQELEEFLITFANAHNDETALYILRKIEKTYEQKEKEKGKLPIAAETFNDYLMDTLWWKLPDREIERERERGKIREYDRATLLKTKFWILERVAKRWRSKNILSPQTPGIALRAFQFLLAAHEPLHKDWGSNEAEFKEKSRGRWVSKEEKNKIATLIQEHATNFPSEELEEWMEQPWLPYIFERTLAIARTSNGGRERWGRKTPIWRTDIRNARLIEVADPDNLSKAGIELLKSQGKNTASVDRSVQKLIESMTEGHGWSGREEIGKSEYVLGKIEFKYNHLFEVIISIQVDSEYPEALFQDNFGRARRHINSWLKEHHPFQIHLVMTGGQTNAEETDTLQGESYRQPQ